jgi:Kef-type K+ transport system membrane component KefB/Trk K+ transport system NAD-binding subunit
VEEQFTFMPLLLVILLAFVVPLALSRVRSLRLPVVVGEIIAGILVGRSGLGWVPSHDAVLDLLAQFGFVFLMFLAGMEIDFSNLGVNRLVRSRAGGPDKSRWNPATLGGLTFALTLALSTTIGLGLTALGLVRNSWMMALILSTTSLGVVMPVLKERGLSAGRFGQTILIAALVADFATMLLITVVVAAMSRGITPDILLIGLLFVAFFLVYYFGNSLNRIKAVRAAMEELAHTPARIKVRLAFATMLAFVVLSEVMGTEVILGAFLAGVIVSLLRTPDDADLAHQLDAIGFGFFIPIFFVMVGVRFNLAALLASTQAMVLVPLLLAAAVFVKLLPALVLRLQFGWREALSAGALLSARLSLIIAASAIGMRLGVITESVNTSIILIAIITVVFAPMVFTRLAPQPESAKPRPLVVVGAGELGLHIAQQLRAHHEFVVVVDPDETHVARARQRGLEAIVAQAELPNSSAAPFFENAQAVICALMDTEINYRVCQLARWTYGIDHVIAQVNEPNEFMRFEQLGVRPMHAAVDRAALFVLLARNPAMYSLLTRTDDDKEVCEVEVCNGALVGKTLRQLTLPGDVLVLALRRDGELMVPHGNTQISQGDHLTLVGLEEHVEVARQMLECAEV